MIPCQRELGKLESDPETLPRAFNNTIITLPDFEMGEHCCRCRRVAAWPGATIKSVASRVRRIVYRPRPSVPLPSASVSVLSPDSSPSPTPTSPSPSPSSPSPKVSSPKPLSQRRPSPKPLLPEPTLDCPVIQLPIEILACVIDHLSEIDRHVLSVTCRAFWNAIRLALRQGPTYSLSQYEYLCYLTRISRNNPDLWVCEACNKLHPAGDPMSEIWNICPSNDGCGSLAGDMKLNFLLQHRNVQRALKLSRLGNLDERQRETLNQLTRPHRASIQKHSTIMGTIRCEYTSYPKIVQGRFLLLSVWAYDERNEPISRQNMESLSICRHQRLNGYRSALDAALETALRRPRTPVDGSCTECPVDFSVNFSPKRTTVHAWHDFGPEGTPLDPAWIVHFFGRLYRHHDPTVGHAEGSVREMYESSK
ncbi:uncharacterized protein NECHADRAFT_86680 [Fusarium vanettenii 77-13-4]|uniref:F-box domain-containing protein n=1 Tax=Fusarium vanettenii (strain ATCC MYA-4622 / CBS 123669 / FGSC 9596 / NRRL 45880 / 77-13-4) TaxID=660122 RepID=C7ZFU6_FUSV7|nr:uncharacterized protein NECHADRAFT_86680 [Fusarium vanettenii 77-13-4]EEU37097.1 hypothetical protein NECHADRAFT_86680 [Fusarium vanettenii 77-13-4]